MLIFGLWIIVLPSFVSHLSNIFCVLHFPLSGSLLGSINMTRTSELIAKSRLVDIWAKPYFIGVPTLDPNQGSLIITSWFDECFRTKRLTTSISTEIDWKFQFETVLRYGRLFSDQEAVVQQNISVCIYQEIMFTRWTDLSPRSWLPLFCKSNPFYLILW